MPLIPSVSKSWLRGAALFSLGGALVVYTALLLFPAPVTTPSSPVLVAYDLSTIGAGAATLPAGWNISRASTGSAQTGTSTVVTGIAVDTPRGGRRLDADPVALVVEEGRTNRVLNSANWTLGGWAISGGGSTNTANAAASPDGTTTATHVTTTTTTGTAESNSGEVATAGTYTVSAWLRQASGTGTTGFNFYRATTGRMGTLATVGTAWARLSLTGAVNGTENEMVGPVDGRDWTGLTPPGLGSGARDAYGWAAQRELGAFATEIIPTTTAVATRAPDRVWLTTGTALANNGQLSLAFALQPKGSSTSYSANLRFWTTQAGDYAEVDYQTRQVRIQSGGGIFLTAAPMVWAANDSLDVFITVGPVVPTQVHYRVNGGATVVLDTSLTTLPASTVSGTLDVLCNGTANTFSAWFRSLVAYKSGGAPSWVTLAQNPTGSILASLAVSSGTPATTDYTVGAPTVADSSSLASSDLTSPLAHANFPTQDATADVATVSDGADGVIRTYYLNRAQNAAGQGVISSMWRTGASTTTVTLSFEAKVPAGVGTSQTINTGILNAGMTAWLASGPSAPSFAADGAWHTFSQTYTVTADTDYQVPVTVNFAAPQQRLLVRSLRVVANDGNVAGLAAPWTRVDVRGSTLYDNGPDGLWPDGNARLVRVLRMPTLGRVRLDLGGATSVVLEYYSDQTSYPNLTKLGVWQAGTFIGATAAESSGTIVRAQISGISATGGPVDIYAGSALSNTSGTTANVTATVLRAVYVPGATTVLRYGRAPGRRQIVRLGDSISVGFKSSIAAQYSDVALLRNALYPLGFASEGWGGRRLYDDAADTATINATVARLLAYGTGNVVVIESISNDFGGPPSSAWTPAAFGTQLAALIDALHLADPTARVVLVKPLQRSDQASTNIAGGVLADYAAQQDAVQATRTAWCYVMPAPLTTMPASGDSLHPNDANFATMAANELAWFQVNGLASTTVAPPTPGGVSTPTGWSFTRPSTASVQTGTSTVTTGIAVDTLRAGRRLDGDPVAYVVEESRTNQLLNNRDLTNASWAVGTGTTTHPGTAGPDGAASASRIVAASGSFGNYSTASGLPAGLRTGSLWVRTTSGGAGLHQLYQYDGTTTTARLSVLSGAWQRVSQTITAAATSGQFMPLTAQDRTANGGGNPGALDNLIDLAQVEAGGFPTEAIPTTTATTRAADRLQLTSGSSIIDGGQLSFAARLQPKGGAFAYSAALTLAALDSTHYVEIDYQTARVRFVDGASTWVSDQPLSWAANDVLDIYVSFGAQATQVVYRLNGGTAYTLGTTAAQGSLTASGAVDVLNRGGANVFTCWLRDAAFYKSGQGPAWIAGAISPALLAADFSTQSVGAGTVPSGWTFTRASTATVADFVAGTVTTGVAVDTPRIGRSAAGRVGMRFEESRTNLITQGRDLTAAGWQNGTNVTTTANYGGTAGPDGTFAATRVQLTASESLTRYWDTTSDLQRVYSVWGHIGPTLTGVWNPGVLPAVGITSGTTVNAVATSTWQRQVLTAAAVRYAVPCDDRTGFPGGTNPATARDLVLDMNQLENAAYATEWIPTSGTTGTRAGDSFNPTTASAAVDSGTVSLYVAFEAQAARASYTGAGNTVIFDIDGSNNAASITSGSAIRFALNGTVITSTASMATFVRGDYIEIFLSGGARGVPIIEWRINNGAVVNGYTGASTHASWTPASTLVLFRPFNNTTTAVLSGLYSRVVFYRNGYRPGGF
jgi:hypothetical protein